MITQVTSALSGDCRFFFGRRAEELVQHRKLVDRFGVDHEGEARGRFLMASANGTPLALAIKPMVPKDCKARNKGVETVDYTGD